MPLATTLFQFDTTSIVCTLCYLQIQRAIAYAKEEGEHMLQFYHQAIQRRLSKDAKFSHLNIAF